MFCGGSRSSRIYSYDIKVFVALFESCALRSDVPVVEGVVINAELRQN
jgi:hypothetical protein